MKTSDQGPAEARVRVMQIIHTALILGLVTFLGVVVVVRQNQVRSETEDQAHAGASHEENPFPIVSALAVVMMVGCQAASLGVTGAAERAGVARVASGANSADDVSELMGLRQTVGIIRAALTEGPGFLGCIGYLLEGGWLGLAVAGVALLGFLITFPTGDGVRTWLEQKLQSVKQARQSVA